MGSLVAQTILTSERFDLVAALDHAKHPSMGRDVGEANGFPVADLAISDSLSIDVIDVMVDFSMRDASVAMAKLCGSKRIPLLVATTGHTPQQLEEVLNQGKSTALLVAANTSLVVNVLLKLTELTGKSLKGNDFDVEIIERHHRHKIDAPSGTALKFADVVQQAMGLEKRIHGREGDAGPRSTNEIGIHAIRAGDFVGEHTILFSTPGETLELVHRGQSRDSYVKGALKAAEFLVGKEPGTIHNERRPGSLSRRAGDRKA